MSIGKNNIILAFIILLSLLLRLWRVGEVPVSLFGDELDVGYHAYSILKTGKDYQGNFMPLHFNSVAEWRTPLYLYAAVPTVAIFGISPLGVRLPAILFGVLGVWGIYLLVKEILTYGVKASNFHPRALFAAFILAVSPWHLQYSRAGFEVTMLLAFLIFGLYFFLRAVGGEGKFLWISVFLFVFTPWIYNTAKLFTPLLILFLIITWKREIFGIGKSALVKSAVAGLIIGVPIIYSTVFGGGSQRAGYVSVFTDETTASEVESMRLQDTLLRDEPNLGWETTFWDRFYHNKGTVWTKNITNNYLEAFSFSFLFINGDPNLRHSLTNTGVFYKIEALALILGLIFFFSGKINVKVKRLVVFWLLIGALPSALTRDGGNHATRLILILPPLIFLISYGVIEVFRKLNPNWRYVFLTSYFLLLASSFLFYLHNYYNHYPWESESWWHAGMGEAFQSIKQKEAGYDKVILSMSGEPMWIFFAGWTEYPPQKWQSEFAANNKADLEGFGEISHIGKYYFGSFNEAGQSIYDLDKYLDNRTLYLANANEIGADLLREPERTPANLTLIDAISYPSGAPAYYLLTKK